MKQIENIKPDKGFISALKKRRSELTETLAKLELKVKTEPAGSLYFSQGKYYHALSGKRRYIRKSDLTLAKALAQKAYDRAVAARIKAELALLTPLIALNEAHPIRALWTHLKPARRDLIEPETRTEFVWEHFGLMDDENYRVRNEEKLESFSFSGTFLDRPLLVTFEEKEHPLDPEKVREKLAFFVAALKARPRP